jgi:rubrerythrin
LLSKVPANLDRMVKKDLDNEIIRDAIIAELDTVNLYEQMAALTENKQIKMIFLDVAKEEKTYVGEFQAFLLGTDPQ